jgi:hypothetical protein
MPETNGAFRRLLGCLLLPLVLSLALATPATSASPHGERYSEGGGSDEHGNGAFWRISSVAQPSSASPACETVSASVFLTSPTLGVDRGWQRPPADLYCYTYRIQNKGDTPIKIGLPGSDVIRSPLTKVMQDFSIEVDAHSSAVLVFLAESEPKEIFSPVDIAIWDPAARRWGFIRSGPVTLYLPSRPNLIAAASVEQGKR